MFVGAMTCTGNVKLWEHGEFNGRLVEVGVGEFSATDLTKKGAKNDDGELHHSYPGFLTIDCDWQFLLLKCRKVALRVSISMEIFLDGRHACHRDTTI